MVFVDRAPIRSGWTHVWTRVAVITYFVASTASVLPNGSTDFPLAHFFEAIASATGSIRCDVAPAIVSSLLILGYHLHTWGPWMVAAAGLGCLCYYWGPALEAFGRIVGMVIGPSPRWLNHEARMDRLGWIRWCALATYLVLGLGSFGYVYDGGLGDFAFKDFASKISDSAAHISISKCAGAGLSPTGDTDFRQIRYNGIRFTLKDHLDGTAVGANNLPFSYAGSHAQRGDAGLSRGYAGLSRGPTHPTRLAEPAARPAESGHLGGPTLPAPHSTLKIAGVIFVQRVNAGLSRRLTATRPTEPTHRRNGAGFSGDLRDLQVEVRLPKEGLRTVHLPLNVSLEVLLIEIGAGIFFFYSLFFLFLAAVATQVLVGTSKRLRPLLKVGAVASVAYVHVGLARWLWTGGYISWAPLATVSALVFWCFTMLSTLVLAVSAYAFAVERITNFKLNQGTRLVLMAGPVLVALLWMPWVTAAAWAVVTVLRAGALSYEFGRVLLIVAEVRAAQGRGKAEEEERRRVRRLDLVKNCFVPHFALRLDEASKYLTAKIAAGWAEATDGEDPAPLTWRGCAFMVAATAAALPSRWLLGLGLGLVCASPTPSWLLYGLVQLTLTPRLGSLLWGGKVGRHLVSNVCRVIDFALLRMFPPKDTPTPVCSMARNRPGCGRPPPVQRQALRDLFDDRVDALLAGIRHWESMQEEDYRWLCGEAADHEKEANEVFEASLKDDAGQIVSVVVLRRDYASDKSTFSRALCLPFDRARVYVVPHGSLLKAEAPPAQWCGADREASGSTLEPLEQYRRHVDKLRRSLGTDLNIATALGLMAVEDVEEQTKEWLSESSAGEALNQRLAMVSTAAKARSVYAAKEVAKWASTAGSLLTYSLRLRASSTNTGSLAERTSLAGHLYAACPVWREAFSTDVPVLPELQQDTVVLGKAALNAIRVPLSETMSEEAAGLGYVAAESTELIVPANWDTWSENQVSHAAGVVREYLVEAQTKLLKRLWDAHGLSAILPAVAEDGSSVWQEAWGEPRAGAARMDTSGSASTTEGTGTGGSGSGSMESSETGSVGGAGSSETGGAASSGGASHRPGDATTGGGGGENERLLTLQLLQQLTLQASSLAINATSRSPATRSVIEQVDEARHERKRLFAELSASSSAQMVSSNIGAGAHNGMIGKPLSGVRATDESHLATLVGVQHSILSGRPFTSPLPADNYTTVSEERAFRASQVRHISTHPICAPCTLEGVLEERKATSRDLSAPVSDEEWLRNLHHADTPDAVFCHSSDHSLLNAKGTGKVYCAPPPGIPTPCGVCGVIQFHACKPRTNCTSCGVPYYAAGSEFKLD